MREKIIFVNDGSTDKSVEVIKKLIMAGYTSSPDFISQKFWKGNGVRNSVSECKR